jgi:hypothetical protein
MSVPLTQKSTNRCLSLSLNSNSRLSTLQPSCEPWTKPKIESHPSQPHLHRGLTIPTCFGPIAATSDPHLLASSTQIHNNQSVVVGWCGLGVQRHHRSVVLTMMGSGENIDRSVNAPIRLLLLPNTHPNALSLGQHT